MQEIAIVHWLDSRQPSPSWMYLGDLPEFSPVECRSIGWILRHDESMVVLASNIGDVNAEEVQVSGVVQIPTCCVIEIAVLEGK